MADLPVQLCAGRWEVAPRPGKDRQHIVDLMERDLDRLTEQSDRFAQVVKLRSAGLRTLAARA